MQIKSHIYAFLSALLVQYPVGLAFIAPILVVSSYSLARAVETVGFYWFATTIVAAPIILLIGIPVFHLLRRRGAASKRVLGLAGAVAALAISAVLTWPIHSEGFSTGQNYYGVFRDMNIDGVPTFWGWVRYVEDLLMFSIHGLLGGMAFGFGWHKANLK
ncbi:MAG: hypothetical protein AAFN50_05460 [Pseudomonadota bacterium]